jgi:hypothetical protein
LSELEASRIRFTSGSSALPARAASSTSAEISFCSARISSIR